MSMTNDDLVGQFLNEQARVNALNDEGDVNTVVEDLQQIDTEQEVGFDGDDGTNVDVIAYSGGPHRWGDDDMTWGFFTWP